MKKNIEIAQFGEGNFLRAFADEMIDAANKAEVFDGGVAIIKPIPLGDLSKFEAQGLKYNVVLRGMQNGEAVVTHRRIDCICSVVDPYVDFSAYLGIARGEALRFVISNTTEAGIAFDAADAFENKPAHSFPGKLTQFLYERYVFFAGAADKGLIVLPAELIEQNGSKLRDFVLDYIKLWALPDAFAAWVRDTCLFCNTLVDRIVSGYPADEAQELARTLPDGRDDLMVVGEPFGLWVIAHERYEAVQAAFPLDKAGLPVVFCADETPYRVRKVRLLNGAHTTMVFAAHLSGFETVGEAMADATMRAFVKRVLYDEIAPTVPLGIQEVRAFADSVIERFDNPFIKHRLLSIALNSVSKWKTRVMPTLLDYQAATGNFPSGICLGLAAMKIFYDKNTGDTQDGADFPLFWDAEIGGVAGLKDYVCSMITEIQALGLQEVLLNQLSGGDQ
ncbi:MAG: tagaturonate reductase [Defluviitaleaceae bacterium]|nr:tagaturonate reductase [Defluviitaleaceae bacterium]